MAHRVTRTPGDGTGPTAVIAGEKSLTYDMEPTRDDPTAVGTSEVADAIIQTLEQGVLVS